MSNSVMLDIETLATTPDAVILSFAAVKFNEFNPEDRFYDQLNLAINVDEQIGLGRRVDQDTVNWWGKQPAEVQAFAFQEQRTSLADFVNKLNKFIVATDRIWAQGPVFDIAILENLYRQLGKPIPWKYFNIRDSRTLIKALGSDIENKRENAHDALADCKYQAHYIKKIAHRHKLQTL